MEKKLEDSDNMPKKKTDKKNKQKQLLEQKLSIQIEEGIQKYDLSGEYKVGQIIYHPVFKDTGKVLRKMKSITGNYKKIIVKFKNVGEKILVEGLRKKEKHEVKD